MRKAGRQAKEYENKYRNNALVCTNTGTLRFDEYQYIFDLIISDKIQGNISAFQIPKTFYFFVVCADTDKNKELLQSYSAASTGIGCIL